MNEIAKDTRLPADIDAQPAVEAAAALRPVIRGYREEIEREQRLPKALVEQFHAAGFYSMVIPKQLGGLQVDPLSYLRVVELLVLRCGLDPEETDGDGRSALDLTTGDTKNFLLSRLKSRKHGKKERINGP